MRNNNNFEIKARTCVLKSTSNQDSILNNSKYIIPIYQRPYSWKEEQIEKLIQDIFIGYYNNEQIFIGTMQISHQKNETEAIEIIDGQQRLTTFLLIFKYLNIHYGDKIETIDTSWLSTKVNNNTEQEFLFAVLESNENQIKELKNTTNTYAKNYDVISSVLSQYCTVDLEENPTKFEAENFINYILNNIYFVLIQTKAGLSKTIQIFNAINTTGLDLNTGDLFKIRMYEYLKDKENRTDEVFNEISELYSKISINNIKYDVNITIDEILNMYKYLLIATYNLPPQLYDFSTENFYDLLFNAILNKDYSEYFNKNILTIQLSLDAISQLIDARFNWLNYKYTNGIITSSVYFIWWSRYSKYSILINIFLYRFKDEPNLINKLEEFINQLSKLYLIYSIRFQKSIYEIHGFSRDLNKYILSFDKTYDDIIELINNKIGNIDNHNIEWYNLENTIKGDITYNSKLKNLLCRLSALLEEDYKTIEEKTIKEIIGKIFYSSIDIEHIQSYLDKDKFNREDVLDEWGKTINSLGNLVVLEQNINRSISNNVFVDKKVEYKKSVFNIVRNISKNEKWNLDEGEKRLDIEYKKITDYLFSK